MGATGHSAYRHTRHGTNTETFGIANAVNFRGKVPENSGLSPTGGNRITLKIPAQDGNNVLFQFKLSRDGDTMTITGFKNGIPEIRCKVEVDSGRPSLDKVIATGDSKEKIQAVKMKNLFSQSTEIKENQLGAIANKLIQAKEKKEGIN